MTVEGEDDAPTLELILADPAPTTTPMPGDVVAIAQINDVDTNSDSSGTFFLDISNFGAFDINPETGEITISNLFSYLNPPNGVNHVIEVSFIDSMAGETESVLSLIHI